MNTDRTIAEWAGWPDGFPKLMMPDTEPLGILDNIRFWHETLFPLIEEGGLANRFGAILATNTFGEQWMDQFPTGSCWTTILRSTSAQLTKALAKVIEEIE